MNHSIRVLLCDDDKWLRACVRLVLAKERSIEIVGDAESGQAAIQLVSELKPEIILMDVALPDMDGALVTRQVLALAPGLKVLVFSPTANGDILQEMLDAGASGCVLKRCAPEELIQAMSLIMAGQFYLGTGIQARELQFRQPLTVNEQLNVFRKVAGNAIGDVPFE